jgi:hypothetical protein
MQNNGDAFVSAGFTAPSVRILVPATTTVPPSVRTDGLSSGAIAGIIVGGLVAAIVLVIIIVLIAYCW